MDEYEDALNQPARPEHFWHCYVEMAGVKGRSIVNDLTFAELEKTVVSPWLEGRPFTVSGTIVRSADAVTQIKIVHTTEPQRVHSDRHYAQMSASGIMDMATDGRLLPFAAGEDFTFSLLFEGAVNEQPESERTLVETVCRRLPQAVRVLSNRSRKDRSELSVSDEYDVQDVLHAVLRAHLKYSVQEDPMPKVAGVKSGRADLSIEELGVLIEIKYVRGPADQKRLFEEFSQDLVLYSRWAHLRTLLFLVYNSADLRDAEALEKLGGKHELSGVKFDVKVILC